MEKATFVAILEEIVRGFEEPAFRANYADAKAQGNVPRLMELAMGVQGTRSASTAWMTWPVACSSRKPGGLLAWMAMSRRGWRG